MTDFVPGPGLYRAEMSVSEGAGGGGGVESATKTRTLVVARRSTLLVRAREGVDAFLVR